MELKELNSNNAAANKPKKIWVEVDRNGNAVLVTTKPDGTRNRETWYGVSPKQLLNILKKK